MSSRTVFPAFMRLEYDPSGNGGSELQRAVDQAFNAVDSRAARFRASAEEIGTVVGRAVTSGVSAAGKLDLGVDKFRQAAAEARLHEQALRDLQRTTAALAAETGDTSQATKLYQQALASQVIEARQASQAAEAQVSTYTRLQTALDLTSAQNSKLAASYREVFAEQAKQAQAEVQSRNTQQGYNQVFAPGLTSRATDNGAGFGALAEQAQREAEVIQRLNSDLAVLEQQFIRTADADARAAQIASTAAAEQAASLEMMRQAEASAAEGARILELAHRGTTLEIGRSGKSAAESAQAFMQYDRQLEELKASLDPAYYAQKRFDDELEFANQALQRGDINRAQYKQRVAQLTAEQVLNTNATRSQRFAYLQMGQQMQDSVIQAEMGTSVFVILTQQGSQAAYALSGLAGSANKVEGAVGKAATVLSGPWGAAALIAVSVVGGLVAKYLDLSDAVGEAVNGLKKQAEQAEVSRQAGEIFAKTLEGHIALQKKLNDELERTILTQNQIDDRKIREAQGNVGDLQGDRRNVSGQLATARTRAADAAKLASTPGLSFDPDTKAAFDLAAAIAAQKVKDLEKQLKEIDLRIAGAQRNVRFAEAPVIEDQVKASLDASTAATDRYTAAVGRLRQAYADGKISRQDYSAGFAAEEKRLKAAQAAIKAQEDAARKAGRADPNDATLSQVERVLINKFGGTITSTTGGKHVAGSDHYAGRAVDFVPAGGMGAVSKEQIRAALQEAGISIRTNKNGVEQLFDNDNGKNDHFHVAWQGGKTTVDSQRINEQNAAKVKAAMEAQDRAAAAMGVTISSINRSWGEQPKLIDQAAAAREKLDAIEKDIADRIAKGNLTPKQLTDLKSLQVEAAKARTAIEGGMDRPYREMVKSAQQRQQVEQLILSGQYDQAEALQRQFQLEKSMGDLLPGQKATLLAIVKAERLRADAIEEQRKRVSLMVSAIGDVRQGFEDMLMGGKIEDFGKSIVKSFKQLQVKMFSEQIFGGLERKVEALVTGQGSVSSANEFLSSQMTAAGTSANLLADVFGKVAARVDGIDFTGVGANDNRMGVAEIAGPAINLPRIQLDPIDLGSVLKDANEDVVAGLTEVASNTDDIVVVGKKQIVQGDQQTKSADEMLDVVSQMIRLFNGGQGGYGQVLKKGVDEIGGLFKNVITPDLAKTLGKIGGGAMAGYTVGSVVGSVAFGGSKNGQTGSQIGGAIGGAIGSSIPGGTIIGSIVGSIAGGLIGGLIKGKPMLGGTVITSASEKDSGAWGRYGGLENVNTVSGGVQDSLKQISDTLGTTLGNFRVGVGNVEWNGQSYYRVSANGKYNVGAADYYESGAAAGDVVYDGTDAEAALRAAVQNAIEDGALVGLREGTKNMLAKATDIDAALQDALTYENAFKTLKQYTDPVGAALDVLNASFSKLKDIAIEAGASTEEMADLEKLYQLQRKDAVEQATQQLTASLKSLYSELTTGDSGLSIRERMTNAQAEYDPLKARVQAGDTTAYSDYADAAKKLLDLEREAYGSQDQYFNLLSEVTALTKGRLDAEQAKIDAVGSDTMFDTAPVVQATQTQTDALLAGFSPLFQSIAKSSAELLALVKSGALTPNNVTDTSYTAAANF
jgi:hypothetical protein